MDFWQTLVLFIFVFILGAGSGFIIVELYMSFRLKRILAYLHKSSIPFEIYDIARAQRNFWVWPIKRAFKS